MTHKDAVVDVAQAFARYRSDLEAFLRDAIPSTRTAPDLYAMLRYHMGWLDENLEPIARRSGKMIRPNLCLVASEACGGDYRQAIPAAAAVELLHNFSLIHDDVEDRGTERRGRRTVWAKWGEPLAVNAGDALLIVSELALLRSLDVGLTPSTTLTLVALLNDCCLTLTEGQHLDITHERDPRLGEADYLRTIGGKTAALLGCAAQLGAVAAGAPAERSSAFRRYGEYVGLGFQIQDDVLGIWGKPAETGKPEAADVFGCKITLPVIDAVARAPDQIAARIAAVYRSGSPSGADVAEIIGYLNEFGVRERAEARAGHYLDQALGVLDEAQPAPVPGDVLRALAQSLIGRKT